MAEASRKTNLLKKPGVCPENYPCHIFRIADAEKAHNEFHGRLIRNYGEQVWLQDGSILHSNHVWDDGGRRLLRCKDCGGLLLKQTSEFHGIYGEDGYYEDWIPAATEEEGEMLNILLDALELENYPCRHLRGNNCSYMWIGDEEAKPCDPEDLKRRILEKYRLKSMDVFRKRKRREQGRANCDSEQNICGNC